MDFEDLLINSGVAVLLAAIKSPKKKAKLRAICLKIMNSIKVAFAGDPDFA